MEVLDFLARRENPDHPGQDSKDFRETPEEMDSLVYQEVRDRGVFQELQVLTGFQVEMDYLVLQDLKASQDSQDYLATLVHQEKKGYQEFLE